MALLPRLTLLTSESSQRHALVLGGLIIVAGLVAASDALHSRAAELLAYCEALIRDFPVLGVALFVLLAAASAMLAFFSSALLVPVGIYAWGAVVCFGLLWLGWFIGGVLAFAIGRCLGRRMAAAIIGERRMAELSARIDRRSRFPHLVLFQAAVPSEIPGYLLGSLHFQFLPFAAALALAELPYAFATVYLGSSFLERDSLELVAMGAGGLLVAAVLLAWLRRFQVRGGIGQPGD